MVSLDKLILHNYTMTVWKIKFKIRIIIVKTIGKTTVANI